LSVLKDYNLGEESTYEMNGPRKLAMFDDQYLISSGAIMDSNYDSTYPRGVLFVFDKDDISTVLTTSLKLATDGAAGMNKFYGFDVSTSL
jgi:hypothetical protein